MNHFLPKENFEILQSWANELRGFYDAPVYLCGSALQKENYRDVDVRIILSDYEFGCRYGILYQALECTKQWIEEGSTGKWTNIRWKWSDDCTKITRRGWNITNLNIDFQVYPESYCENRYKGLPKLKIDMR
jgi:hypothetical protein